MLCCAGTVSVAYVKHCTGAPGRSRDWAGLRPGRCRSVLGSSGRTGREGRRWPDADGNTAEDRLVPLSWETTGGPIHNIGDEDKELHYY